MGSPDHHSGLAGAAGGHRVNVRLPPSSDLTRLLEGGEPEGGGPLFPDARIACGGVSFEVHRCILAMRVPFFRRLFLADRSRTVVDFKEFLANVTGEVLGTIVRLIHGKVITIHAENAREFLAAGCVLGIVELCEGCSEVIASSLKAENSIEFWLLALSHQQEGPACVQNLAEACQKLAANSLRAVAPLGDFKALAFDRVSTLMRASESGDRVRATAWLAWLQVDWARRHVRVPEILPRIAWEQVHSDFGRESPVARAVIHQACTSLEELKAKEAIMKCLLGSTPTPDGDPKPAALNVTGIEANGTAASTQLTTSSRPADSATTSGAGLKIANGGSPSSVASTTPSVHQCATGPLETKTSSGVSLKVMPSAPQTVAGSSSHQQAAASKRSFVVFDGSLDNAKRCRRVGLVDAVLSQNSTECQPRDIHQLSTAAVATAGDRLLYSLTDLRVPASTRARLTAIVSDNSVPGVCLATSMPDPPSSAAGATSGAMASTVKSENVPLNGDQAAAASRSAQASTSAPGLSGRSKSRLGQQTTSGDPLVYCLCTELAGRLSLWRFGGRGPGADDLEEVGHTVCLGDRHPVGMVAYTDRLFVVTKPTTPDLQGPAGRWFLQEVDTSTGRAVRETALYCLGPGWPEGSCAVNQGGAPGQYVCLSFFGADERIKHCAVFNMTQLDQATNFLSFRVFNPDPETVGQLRNPAVAVSDSGVYFLGGVRGRGEPGVRQRRDFLRLGHRGLAPCGSHDAAQVPGSSGCWERNNLYVAGGQGPIHSTTPGGLKSCEVLQLQPGRPGPPGLPPLPKNPRGNLLFLAPLQGKGDLIFSLSGVFHQRTDAEIWSHFCSGSAGEGATGASGSDVGEKWTRRAVFKYKERQPIFAALLHNA